MLQEQQRLRAEQREEQKRLREEEAKRAKRRKPEVHELTPHHTLYWAESSGAEGGKKPWRFSCFCGEVCSSYENWRYHPVGRMFECTRCTVWSHVSCVLGNISDETIEELEDALCGKCHTEMRRKRLGELRELRLEYRFGEIVSTESGKAATALASSAQEDSQDEMPRDNAQETTESARGTTDSGVDLETPASIELDMYCQDN
jgi:hypothetical protein